MTAQRLVLAVLLLASVGACNRKEIADGGVYITRSICPQVGIPAGTGDVTLFNPAGSTDASAIDVVATITNLRAACNDAGAQILSTADFDVVATRRDAGPARTVVLPYYDIAMQGGNQVVAKRVGQVAVAFAAGSQRGAGHGQASISVSRAATTLSAEVRRKLTAPRKVGKVEAAVDPMTDPTVRDAVARATFEHLIGFQLTQAQLRYNATR